MSYEYEHAVPFEYKRYKVNKQLELSDKIKCQLDNFYQYIDKLDIDNYKNDKGKIDTDKLVAELSKAYAKLRDKYIKPVVTKVYKYKSVAYTQEEIDFIFQCSYRLIEKFGLSQANVSTIFFLYPNKFSKLDCYPMRSYNAYTKLDDSNARRSLVPFDTRSEGIQIAEVINKQIQAVYGCYGFAGVTNDLDVFANIATPDRKAFVLTSPYYFSEDENDKICRANISLARYNFALGNRLFDGKNYVPAGKIKEKILDILTMKDFSAMSESQQEELVKQLLLSDANITGYSSDAVNTIAFNETRLKLQIAYQNMNIEHEKINDGYVNTLVEYYDEKMPADYERLGDDASADEIVRNHYEYWLRRYGELWDEMLGLIDLKKILESKNILFSQWISLVIRNLKVEIFSELSSMTRDDEENEENQTITYEDRLTGCASYWISEVFADGNYDEDYVKKVIDYLGSYSPIFTYWDAFSFPPKVNNKASEDRSKIHVHMIDESGSLYEDLMKLPVRYEEMCGRPFLFYVDTEAHGLDIDFVENLFKNWMAILVVHDKSRKAQKMGMLTLNEELCLYYKLNVEA